jgi:error-prone DNA polymerase
MTAIRCGTTLANAGTLVFPNGERTLKSPTSCCGCSTTRPRPSAAPWRSCRRVDQFSFDDLRYTFSQEELPPGMTRTVVPARAVRAGPAHALSLGVPEPARKQIRQGADPHRRARIRGLLPRPVGHRSVRARRGILCQGRGSAANSAVCYVLQITAIDPVRMNLLFERFLSMERKEPPDIDVDFEHARREEVLQYVYEKHGRTAPRWSASTSASAGSSR